MRSAPALREVWRGCWEGEGPLNLGKLGARAVPRTWSRCARRYMGSSCTRDRRSRRSKRSWPLASRLAPVAASAVAYAAVEDGQRLSRRRRPSPLCLGRLRLALPRRSNEPSRGWAVADRELDAQLPLRGFLGGLEGLLLGLLLDLVDLRLGQSAVVRVRYRPLPPERDRYSRARLRSVLLQFTSKSNSSAAFDSKFVTTWTINPSKSSPTSFETASKIHMNADVDSTLLSTRRTHVSKNSQTSTMKPSMRELRSRR